MALGFLAAALLVIGTNAVTFRTSARATQRVHQVQAQHEPLARVAQNLADTLADFDRAVLDHLERGGRVTESLVDDSAARLTHAAAAYADLVDGRAQYLDPGVLDVLLADYQRTARELVQLVERRHEAVRRYWRLFDKLDSELDARRDAAEATGDHVLSRRSIAELSAALDRIQDRLGSYILFAGPQAATEVTEGERAFRVALARHALEFEAVEGKAWFADLSRTFEGMIAERRAIVSLNALLGSGTRKFLESGAAIALRIRNELSEPARRALAASAEDASDTALAARESVATISVAGLVILLLISFATVISVTVPVRRLTRATLHIASGGARHAVNRGGIRELDGLAGAFNHMVAQLIAAERTVRGYQLQLEARVEERTRQLQHLAHHDPLTDLPNRRQLFLYLESLLRTAVDRSERVGLLFLDLDNFKTVNDSLGHEFGDKVLQAVGDRLRCAVSGRGFSARLGGDEFTIVCEGAQGVEDVEAIASATIAEFQQAVMVAGREITIGVSIGASVFPDHAEDAEALLRAADAALFRAKDLGRNRYSIFSRELLDLAAARFQTEQALRRAIEADEFELLYQPQVCFESGQVSAVEALLRWRRAGEAPLSPTEFLHVAEQSGLIAEISAWVLQKAAARAAQWYHNGWPDIRVAVNVSAKQLLDGALVEDLRHLLEKYSIPASCIEVELTENVLQTAPGTVEVLERLRDLGASVALDDFGTGYSSLTSLEQLPLDRIKIDRSLVMSVDTNARSAAIVRSIVGLSRSLGLKVTAEGVERVEQLAFLLGFRGIDVQGFLVASPLNADAVAGFVRGIGARLEDLLLETPEAAFDPNSTGSMVVRHLKAAAAGGDGQGTPSGSRRRRTG
jgi:diguanylate cyclase (GGDEF)-like protein